MQNQISIPSLRALIETFFKIGCLSFGGAAGQIAMMHREIVDEKRWISERDYLDGLNFCTLLPGPEAQQLATYIGWRLHGVIGGLVTGLLFIVPGAVLILALAQLYVLSAHMPAVEGIFLGIKAAVIAIIFDAMIKIARRTLKNRAMQVLSGIVFLLMLLSTVPFPVVIACAALIGVLLRRNPDDHSTPLILEENSISPSEHIRIGIVCLFLWWLPVILAAFFLGSTHFLVEIGVFFSKLAVVTFGGAYALLAYLSDEAVARGWVSAQQMLDGLALAETTPGPTILVNPFIAFVAGWQSLASPTLAWAAGGMALWTTFAPSFLWIFAGAPYMRRISSNLNLRAALEGIGAAVVGIIGSVGVKFTLLYLFKQTHTVSDSFFQIPMLTISLEILNLCLTIIASVLLFYCRWSVLRLIVMLALGGFMISLTKSNLMHIF